MKVCLNNTLKNETANVYCFLNSKVFLRHHTLYFDNLLFQYCDIFNEKLYCDIDPIKEIVNACEHIIILQNVYVST